jgi:hypothetical protein
MIGTAHRAMIGTAHSVMIGTAHSFMIGTAHRSMIGTPHQHYSGVQIRKNEMGGACGTYSRQERYYRVFIGEI